MTESTALLNNSRFPYFASTKLKKTMDLFLDEITKNYMPYFKYGFVFLTENKLGDSYRSLFRIRDLEPEKYKIYFEKILSAYQKAVDEVVYQKVSYKDHSNKIVDTIFCAKFLPAKQSVEIEIRMYLTENDRKNNWITSVYTKEFSLDTPVSAIRENIDYFFRKRRCELALHQLSEDYD